MAPRLVIPDDAAPSIVGVALDICERFAQDPAGGWWEGLDERMQALLLMNEARRKKEEARRLL